MRNHKILTINQRLSCTAFELSVAQIIGLFFTGRDLLFPEDQEKFNTLVRERIFTDVDFVGFSDAKQAKKLNQAERQAVEQFFYQVNADFFIPKESAQDRFQPGDTFSGEDLYQDFIRLIWLNPELASYPYSVVKVMIDNSAQWKEEMKDGE